MLGVKITDFADIWYNAKVSLKFTIFDHHGHVACQNFRFVRYFHMLQDFTKIYHFWSPRTCWESKCQIFQIFGTMQNVYSNWSFWPPRTCCISKFLDFSDIFAWCKVLIKIVIFDHHGHVGIESKCQIFQIFGTMQNFYSNFDICGHCCMSKFFRYFRLMQDFTQICYFWPPWTWWECQIF